MYDVYCYFMFKQSYVLMLTHIIMQSLLLEHEDSDAVLEADKWILAVKYMFSKHKAYGMVRQRKKVRCQSMNKQSTC